ncbi:alpha/beta hydrolase [Streptomyces sp. NPDC059994]|uniref:alpha/beta hydrolase n=1 Tax=Streptomyces sp. NPDC059994 TaxID=3347029 RepID=UPI003676CF6C
MAPHPRVSSRALRTLLAALVVASVAAPLAGAVRPAAVPAPAPAALAPLTAATSIALDARYSAARDGIRAAERMAAGHGDRRRAAALRAMAGPGRHFLSFDGRDGGRTAEVVGDLAHADRIAVLVPGSDTSLDKYGRLRAGAGALQRQMGTRSAVVAWLGYPTPATGSAGSVTTGRADRAAPQLDVFVRELGAAKPGARMAVLCHSYGSVVCARAASELRADALVLYGSPGTGAHDVGQLHTRAAVWAGRASGDWIADVPHLRLPLLVATVGFGTDPVSKPFGARVFDAGTGGHSDYLKPGSVPLRNIALIASGQTPTEERRHA